MLTPTLTPRAESNREDRRGRAIWLGGIAALRQLGTDSSCPPQMDVEASEEDAEPLAQLAGSRGKPGRAAAKAAAAAAGLSTPLAHALPCPCIMQPAAMPSPAGTECECVSGSCNRHRLRVLMRLNPRCRIIPTAPIMVARETADRASERNAVRPPQAVCLRSNGGGRG